MGVRYTFSEENREAVKALMDLMERRTKVPAECCGDCRWWNMAYPTNKDIENATLAGECRRRRPAIAKTGAAGKWPIVMHDDWCGEFKALINSREALSPVLADIEWI